MPEPVTKKIALKVDVDTFRGTREGVPALLALFKKYNISATFLFSLGPDHTGWALRRIFRPGFFQKVQRTSVLSHYGLKTLMYGVLLPGPHIAKRAGNILRSAREQGHEVGIHCYDHVYWQDNVAQRDASWTEREMNKAKQAFVDAFGVAPETHGAAGWQINAHTIAMEEQMGLRYASDCRGLKPFLPSMDGIHSNCVQIPSTLPTLDELIGLDNITEENVDETLAKVMHDAEADHQVEFHVYTLHAELEGMKLLPVMERLIQRWQREGYVLTTLKDIYQHLDINCLPRKNIEWKPLAGRSGLLASEA